MQRNQLTSSIYVKTGYGSNEVDLYVTPDGRGVRIDATTSPDATSKRAGRTSPFRTQRVTLYLPIATWRALIERVNAQLPDVKEVPNGDQASG